jgi:hypothetical protein
MSETLGARPVQAALASAAAFAAGAAQPLLTIILVTEGLLLPLVIGTSLVFLVLLGVLALARVAHRWRSGRCVLHSGGHWRWRWRRR